ncbi:pilus assembly protein TadB [Amylibacter marinus]|uniref:Pilus assembly protein TadB n=1 Tax=Amylibacter marinus TaxID=1475483 RepID=A0ABQ5VQW2_9RHOB|nr:type II secretion system F family protein [Amylibacter marinus]GLQ33792.1 pilus assembly protein TadB [Amylibacter marinus]
MGYDALILVLIFIGVVLMVEGMYLVAFGKSISSSARVNRRLTLIEEGKDHEDILSTLRREREQHQNSFKFPVFSILSKKAAQANIAFSPKALVLVMIVVAIFGFVMLTVFADASFLIRVLVSVIMGTGGVYFWLNSKAKKRLSLFEEQLPDAVDLIVRSLRVGHPFSSAINVVAEEMYDPIGSEFGLIADEATYGLDINSALADMAERIDLQDVRFLAVAVGIQSRSGGNLAEILDGLAKVVRSRFKLFRRVRAITAEAKWSGWFLSIFPFAAIVMVNVTNKGYYDKVAQSPFFVPACIFVGIMLTMNIIIMRALVNIKV